MCHHLHLYSYDLTTYRDALLSDPFELLEKLLHTDDFFRVARLYRNLKESPPLPAESEDIETIDKARLRP